jgi:hypothetical protein
MTSTCNPANRLAQGNALTMDQQPLPCLARRISEYIANLGALEMQETWHAQFQST